MIHPRYGDGDAVIGLPARAVTFTNSERVTAACPLRWLFAEAEGLRPTTRSAPLAMGTAFHACVEDVHLWFMQHDRAYPGDGIACVWCGDGDPCTVCGGTRRGPVAQHRHEWQAYALADASGEYAHEQADKDAECLLRMFEGWLHVHGREPDPEFRIVAPELRMAAPVLSPTTGKPYAPATWLVPDRGGWRLARAGEAALPGAKRVRWPMYQLLTVDALIQHRTTGDLFVYEAKTASSPARRMQSVSVDPQLAGYVWAVQHAVAAGLVPGVSPDRTVRGYVFDVTCNRMQNDPEPMACAKVKALHPDTGEPYKEKGRWVYELDAQGQPIERSPGMKRSGSTIPSWRYRAALQAHGMPEAEYEDHLLTLMTTTDPKLYVREWATSGPEVSARYSREVYAMAQQLAGWRRRAAELTTPEARDLHFPRQAVCVSGYGCAYRAPCLQDGEFVRRGFEVADPVRWVDGSDDDNDNTTQEGSFPW
jgi:hypothetical protein